MRRDEQRRLLWFVLVVMVCGGGCMTIPYRPGQKADLAWAGVDDRVRARLDGHADPSDKGPEPVAGLSGKLLVIDADELLLGHPDQYDHFYGWSVTSSPKEQELDRLARLEGIGEAGWFSIKWPKPPMPPDPQTTLKLSSYRQVMLRQAREAGGDLILLYTSGHKAEATDLSLTLAQFLTLGFAPTVVVSGEADIEAVLIDAHSGYVYAIGQGAGKDIEIANGWTRESRKREAASEATQSAFTEFVGRLESAWPGLRQAYP